MTPSPTWEPWQYEYRHGAFLVVPPAELASEVDRLRQEHDPRSAAICTAHVTLSEPLPRPPTDADLEEVAAALAGFDPFEVHYGPLRLFLPHAGVAFAVGPEERFGSLREAIHATSLFSGIPISHTVVPPHMTIAEFITTERSEQLIAELSATVSMGTFACEEIVHAAPDPSFQFEPIRSIPLG